MSTHSMPGAKLGTWHYDLLNLQNNSSCNHSHLVEEHIGSQKLSKLTRRIDLKRSHLTLTLVQGPRAYKVVWLKRQSAEDGLEKSAETGLRVEPTRLGKRGLPTVQERRHSRRPGF